jgi:DNA-directed RNA polymerase subunit RPC12/RpoP
MAHVKCPRCNDRFELEAIAAKQRVRCPTCTHEFTVSPPSQSQPSPDDDTVEGIPQRPSATDESLLKAIGLAVGFFVFWMVGNMADGSISGIQVMGGFFGSMCFFIGGYFYYRRKTRHGDGE